ncbi:MAG: HAMP domain-containing sensor histidine kinase [Syntrophorhabdales bacterium]|jgi:signal transduction histidine kinase
MNQKDFLYDLLVHDLTGPLSVVATTADGLLSRMDRYGTLSEPQKSCLERIVRNTRKVQLIVKEILDVARSEEHLFQKDDFYLEVLAKEALANVIGVIDAGITQELERLDDRDAVRDFLEGQGITISVAGRYATSRFFHDRRKVQLILENLMSNALKYRRKRMDVSISGEGDAVILVADDGRGIPKGEQEAVGKRFGQLRQDDYAHVQGLGLGLFCVKALVEAMGGKIEVTSGEGRGTTFVVQIPPIQTC